MQRERSRVEDDDRLADVQGGRVERRRAAEPDRVALGRQCGAEGVRTVGPQPAEPGDQRFGCRPGEGQQVGRVLVDDRVDQVVG